MKRYVPYITINESPDATNIRGDRRLLYGDPDAFCFAYEEDGRLFLSATPGTTHGSLAGIDGLHKSPGRLWAESKLLSFWKLDAGFELSGKYIGDLNAEASELYLDWRVSGDWSVEAWTRDDIEYSARRGDNAYGVPSTTITLREALSKPDGISLAFYEMFAQLAIARARNKTKTT